METVGQAAPKLSLMTQLGICEEVAKISAELRFCVSEAKRLNLPASYIIGVNENISKRLDEVITKHSGGIYNTETPITKRKVCPFLDPTDIF